MPETLFMPAPDLFGVWANSGDLAGTPDFREKFSVFAFEPESGGALAKFSICEDMSAQREALVGLRRWMSAVCEYDGFAPANTRMIKTIKPGIAEKRDDGSYKVKEKGFVEFLT